MHIYMYTYMQPEHEEYPPVLRDDDFLPARRNSAAQRLHDRT